MNSRRVFSREPIVSYTDYNRNKKGDEILKVIKTQQSQLDDRNFKIRNHELTSFLDYDTFLNITRSYSRNYLPAEEIYRSPMTVFDAEKSELSYKQLLSHIRDCNVCCQCTNITDVRKCKEANNILYPYGNILGHADNFKYPSKINIQNFNCTTEYYHCDTIPDNNSNHCDVCGDTGHYDKSPLSHILPYGNCDVCGDTGHYEIPRAHCDVCSDTKKPDKYCCVKTTCTISSKCCKKEKPRKPIISIESSMYPSQHNFVFQQNLAEGNNYDREKRMRAFSTYPQLHKPYGYNNNNCYV